MIIINIDPVVKFEVITQVQKKILLHYNYFIKPLQKKNIYQIVRFSPHLP